MKQDTVYYSVSNGGDGSAYPHFFSSSKLAGWHQEHMVSGWGESCTGDLTERDIKGPLDLFFEEIYDEVEDGDDRIENFIKEFFPKGFPKLIIVPSSDNEHFAHVQLDGETISDVYIAKGYMSIEDHQKALDKLSGGK